jgi:nitrite reductase/ring-hydroxylating ferredoxin subunit
MLSKLCKVSSLTEGQARSFSLNGVDDVFALRNDDQFYVYLNRCPHLNVPLNWEPGRFLNPSGDLIQCSTHGALFAIENGECLRGPCLGQYLQVLKYEIIDGTLYLDKQSSGLDKINEK